MALDDKIYKLPLIKLFKDSFQYFETNLKTMLMFSAVNYFILLMAHFIGNVQNPFFLILALGAYIFWAFFFRFYFDKKPYFTFKSLVSSLGPSSKIVFIAFLLITILMWLPLVPLFLGFEVDYIDAYTHFLEKYMEESKAVDLGLNVVFIFVAPLLFYRPMFAWISSLLGRNGNLKFAWNKSKGNYWQMLLLVFVMNLSFVIATFCNNTLGLNWFVIMLILAPITVYFNIIIARSYAFFFIEN